MKDSAYATHSNPLRLKACIKQKVWLSGKGLDLNINISKLHLWQSNTANFQVFSLLPLLL